MPEPAIANRNNATTAEGPSRFDYGFKGVWPIFWAALFVRVLYMTLAHTYRIRPYEDHFDFGWEMARIARALVTGHGYADPFITGHTGPTAWLPPAYTLIIAAAFKLFGVYTPLSAWVLLAINSIFSAATVPAIYEIAARCFNRRVAVWSAWIWALYPAAMQYAVRWVWEMSLTTMLFAWVLVIALRVRGVGEPDHRKSADGSTLVAFRPALGTHRALQSVAAALPAGLRPLDALRRSSNCLRHLAKRCSRESSSSPASRLGRGAIGPSSTPSFRFEETSARSSISATRRSRSPCPGELR